jgi:acyl dehydratase
MKGEKMAKRYNENDRRIPIQKMDVGDGVTTKSRVITRTDVELCAIMGGDYAPQFLSDQAAKENGWKAQLLPGVITLNIAWGL